MIFGQPMNRKKQECKQKRIPCQVRFPLMVAGTAVGMGVVGKAIGSEGLEQAGATTAGFTGVATNIAAGGLVTGMLGDIIKLKQGGIKNGKTRTTNRIF